MSRSFFSNASEDKASVDLVYQEVREAMPEHAPWLDRYQIVGGEDLLSRIASGMDEAEKFFIFLSPISVTKAWVQAELRRAIVRDIKDVNADYVVPVIIGDVDPPAFLEHKRYIDLRRLSREEMIAEFRAAIEGRAAAPKEPLANVRHSVIVRPELPNVAYVVFEAVAYAVPFSFGVDTAADIIEIGAGRFPDAAGAYSNTRKFHERRSAAASVGDPMIQVGRPMALRVDFDRGVDASTAIVQVWAWKDTATS